AAGVRRLGRDLDVIAHLEHAGLLPLDGKLEAAFQHVGRLDTRMGMRPDLDAGLDDRLDQDRRVARRRAVGLRQDVARDAARRGGRLALGIRFARDEFGDPAERTRGETCETSTCQHGVLPSGIRIIHVRTLRTERKSDAYALTRRDDVTDDQLPAMRQRRTPSIEAGRARVSRIRRVSIEIMQAPAMASAVPNVTSGPNTSW